jgi:hypothetical protein
MIIVTIYTMRFKVSAIFSGAYERQHFKDLISFFVYLLVWLFLLG